VSELQTVFAKSPLLLSLFQAFAQAGGTWLLGALTLAHELGHAMVPAVRRSLGKTGGPAYFYKIIVARHLLRPRAVSLQVSGRLISGQVSLKADALVEFDGGGMVPGVGMEPDAPRMRLPLVAKGGSQEE
jgi:hypothetical protein